MTYFIDKTCSIYDTLIVNIDWEDTKSYTAIYSSEPCDFFTNRNNRYNNTQQARETSIENYSVVMNWNKDLCKKGQRIEILDNNWNNLWDYLVENVMFYPDLTWNIDNTTLTISQRDV